jgi:DNA-binding transcriptional regulator of glucitol operon
MRRLLTPRWIAWHVLMVVLVAGMLALAAWQLSRAAGGNMLSWGYTAQWPIFAGFVVFIWAREVRRVWRGPEPAPPPPAITAGARRPVVTRRVATPDPADDPELTAYNRYLAWLNANPTARPADYPG